MMRGCDVEASDGNRMAAVLEAHRDFLFVSSIQEVRGPLRMVFFFMRANKNEVRPRGVYFCEMKRLIWINTSES